MSHQVYLGLGTNLGDRLANLQAARDALARKMKVCQVSAVYETDPWGYTEQPKFYNQVLKVETELSPLGLLTFLKKTEKELGRKENFRYGPRLIDLDILFYDDLVVQMPRLEIPHPRLHERAFVLVPLAEMAAALVHPLLGQSISSLLEKVPDKESVKRI
ncbi:MAG: 2-amino-4-hydroxy-6-hydroxymethyldihydropteridine diphosphokinase [Anaerolineaceae bacterium]|nr:2-amino-4-hydroxy-6-hydroxymethyldihydropteridine diphosphokinase [Anaerolineaceae bacterium]